MMRRNSKLANTAVFVLLACTTWLAAPTLAAKSADEDIATVLQTSGRFQYLSDSLRKSGHLEQLLQTKGPFTVFAAEDKAFDKMGLSSWVSIWGDQRRLRQIMSYNIVKGAFDQSALTAKHELPTMEGHNLRFDVRNNKIFIGKARVGKAIKCSNGVIYVVDRLLAPPQATAGTQPVQ
jgi:uncharacterized surface protein with fasciclin (FAS1) repeats